MTSKTVEGNSRLKNSVVGFMVATLTFVVAAHYLLDVSAQMVNQTATPNKTKAETEKTIPNIANQGPGNNTNIILKDKNIGSPNSTLLQGMEKSQLGNVIPGNQDTTFEGQQLANLSTAQNSSNTTGK